MTGINGFGTSLSRGVSPIASITSLSPPGLSRDTIDVSDHDSPDAWKEFIGGLKDGGEVSIDVNYDPAEHDDLIADFDSDTPETYTIAFPDGSDWEFDAILTGFEPDAPYDNKLTASITFKVTGKPTFSTVSL